MATLIDELKMSMAYFYMREKDVIELSENKKGLWALLWEVLVSPGEAFEELVAQEQPPFLAAALLFTGIAVVLAVVLIPKMQANALWLAQNNPKVTPEQLATGRPIIAIMAAAFLIVGALVVPWLYWLVVAVLLKLYDALFGGRGTSFGALFAVAVYGFLPIQLAAIIAAPIILMTAVENMPWTSLSLAALLTPQKTYLYFFLKQWNPFTWWSLALWGIGWAKCAKTQPKGILIFLFALWLLLSLGMAAIALSQAAAIPG